MTINWREEVEKRREDLLSDLKGLLKIKSVLDEENGTEDAPFGEGVKEALLYLLNKGEESGFTVKNLDNLAGHIEYGSGEEIIGVLCHVDVVPEGDGWSYDPYGAEIHNGNMYARGAIDDKGPTMAAYYGLKIVKELGLPISKRVRLIVGTDEESNWRCVRHYFEHEEMPTMGFAPDADFPIIHAEKGISSVDLNYIPKKSNANDTSSYTVVNFDAGRRYNMVPDYAEVKLNYLRNPEIITESFTEFLQEHNLTGETYVDEKNITLSVQGISAHAMQPEKGTNAALYLACFLAKQNIDQQAKDYFTFIANYLFNDTRGKNLQVNYEDDISGELTVNAAIFKYDATGGKIGLNFRYPVTFNMEDGKDTIEKVAKSNGLEITHFTNSKPHHVDKDHPLIKTLQHVYEEQTGEKAELLAIGGGTYARALDAGVAFGPIFPGKPDVAHQKDEYVEIEELLRACAIYAQAIYELAK